MDVKAVDVDARKGDKVSSEGGWVMALDEEVTVVVKGGNQWAQREERGGKETDRASKRDRRMPAAMAAAT